MIDSQSAENNTLSDWIEFLQVWRDIENVSSLKELDGAQDWLDPWRRDIGSKVDTAAESLSERETDRINQLTVLTDELKRQRSKLRKRPGRQPQNDWLISFRSHSDRLQAELDLAERPIIQHPELLPVLSHLQKSITFSDQLLSADIDQVTKRLAEGEYAKSTDLDHLLKQATSLRNRKTRSASDH